LLIAQAPDGPGLSARVRWGPTALVKFRGRRRSRRCSRQRSCFRRSCSWPSRWRVQRSSFEYAQNRPFWFVNTGTRELARFCHLLVRSVTPVLCEPPFQRNGLPTLDRVHHPALLPDL